MSSDVAFVEWFRPGDGDRVETMIRGMKDAGVTALRTHLSWAEYHADGGQDWYDDLIPKLGAAFDLLPCVHYTPPSLSRTGAVNGAPRELKDYADFIDHVLTRYGAHFRHVEFWNEPNNLLDWDWRADPDGALFSEMIGMAAHWARKRGWKTVLGGPAPFDAQWLDLMGERGMLAECDVVGLHGFPGTWDSEARGWPGWSEIGRQAREIVGRYNPKAEVWLTEAGYSTWRHDELEQARRFLDARTAGFERVYWYGWSDVPDDVAVQEGHWFDPRHYHLGAATAQGRPKLLARMLARGGVAAVENLVNLARPPRIGAAEPVVVTGGSGFIGSNVAESFLAEGRDVLIVDNLSRPGVEGNLDWLASRHGDRLHVVCGDLRDRHGLRDAVAQAGAVIHLAAQTAVTTSIDAPEDDFEINARGTLNLLEALRHTGRAVPLVFASTNKVYGALEHLEMTLRGDRYEPVDPACRNGIGEDQALAFCTPYGCSKGVADQYVLDYAKTYGLPAAVLRMSCIYGPRQFGTEDQGWVAHFLISALQRQPVTLFGTGQQVRDVLEVSDAVAAYRAVLRNIEAVAGSAFNLGGGPANAVSLRDVLSEIEALTGREVAVHEATTRQGDQPWFVADTTRLTRATGWKPQVSWRPGLRRLAEWLAAERGLDLPTPARLSA